MTEIDGNRYEHTEKEMITLTWRKTANIYPMFSMVRNLKCLMCIIVFNPQIYSMR